MMRRGTMFLCLGVVALLAVVAPLFAADTAEIALGGGLVARLRDKGAFSSVGQRAAHIEQQITQVISTKDTLHPAISLKLNKDKLWTVYAWDIELLSVYPAEAKAAGLTDKQVGASWAKNFERQFPLATPCSKLPPEMLGYGKRGAAKPAAAPTAPAKSLVAAPTAAKPPVVAQAHKPAPKPAAKPAPKPAVPAVPLAKPEAAVNPVAAVPVEPAVPSVNESGALLLIVDAMRTARGLDEQAWALQKEALARGLYGDLSYYLTGKGTPPVPVTMKPVARPATKPVAKPAAKPAPKPAVKPVPNTATKPAAPLTKPAPANPITKPVIGAPTTKPVAKPVAKPATKPVAKPPTKPATKPAVKPAAPAPKPLDASMVRVPQKNRIRAKFAQVKPAFDKLAAGDPDGAKPVGDLLAGSRNAFAKGDFDESERLVDEAMKALNVEFKP